MPIETNWEARNLSMDEDFKAFNKYLNKVHFDWKLKSISDHNRQLNAYVKSYGLGECLLTDVLALPIKGQRSLSSRHENESCHLFISQIIDGRGYNITVGAQTSFVKRGEVFVWNSAHQMTFESKVNIRQVSLLVPTEFRNSVHQLINPDKILVLDGHDVLSNMLRYALLTLRRNAHKVTPNEERPVVNAILDLLHACIDAHSDKHIIKKKNQYALLQEANEYIEENLFDTDLSVLSISRALGISTRYLHKLFATTPLSLTKTISEQRTRQAAHFLANTEFSQLSVTDIAFMVGFNDSAYFSRVFKKKFGLPPLQFRQLKKEGISDI